jgi:hypothetical protein
LVFHPNILCQLIGPFVLVGSSVVYCNPVDLNKMLYIVLVVVG